MYISIVIVHTACIYLHRYSLLHRVPFQRFDDLITSVEVEYFSCRELSVGLVSLSSHKVFDNHCLGRCVNVIGLFFHVCTFKVTCCSH